MLEKNLVVLGFIFCFLSVTGGQCSNMMNKKVVDMLYKNSKIIHRKVIDIDSKNDRIIIKDSKEDEDLFQKPSIISKESLSKEVIENLKSKSFTPPKKKVKELDADKDIIYYKDE